MNKVTVARVVGWVKDAVDGGAEAGQELAWPSHALQWDIKRGDAEAVSATIANGSASGARSWSGDGPLEWAVSYSRPAILKLLLEGGVEAVDRTNLLNGACGYAANEQAARMLLEAGFDPNCFDRFGMSPLKSTAVYGGSGCLGCIRALLEHGADPNGADPDFSNTALHEAVLRGRADVVRLLLEGGADSSLGRYDGKSPADMARAVVNNPLGDVLERQGCSRRATALLFEQQR